MSDTAISARGGFEAMLTAQFAHISDSVWARVLMPMAAATDTDRHEFESGS